MKPRKVSRKGSDIYLLNADFTVATPIFVRGLYKCSANILCHNYGSATTRKEYPKLLTFVGEGEDVCPWSYAVSFANPFKRPLISEPMPILIQADDAKVIGFLHSSGIWITGAHPFCLNQHVIEAASTVIVNKLVNDNKCDEVLSCFGSTMNHIIEML